MSAEEIEWMLRMQYATTHSSDPYIDDYYHQACHAKTKIALGVKHHFFPTHLRDIPWRTRANGESHAYLQVNALGRVPFSSIRRPRPLLEVDPPLSFGHNAHEKASEKPPEQETMMAARITLEDGLCVLDIEDIDRFMQIKRRQQLLLEVLATSNQLVDPMRSGKVGNVVGLSPKDDLVFLRLVSLPKGRKLLS